MLVDSLMLAAITAELNRNFLGAIVRKVSPTHPLSLSITLRPFSPPVCLSLSAHARYAHLSWCQSPREEKKGPFEDPVTARFAENLRRHLTHARLLSVEQKDFDRLVALRFVNLTPLGEKKNFVLWCEIMGKHSNLILVDGGTGNIVDALKRLPSSANRYREVLPGKPYVFPPNQGRRNPLTLREADFLEWLRQKGLMDAKSDDLSDLLDAFALSFSGTSRYLLALLRQKTESAMERGEKLQKAFWFAVLWLQGVVHQGAFEPTQWRGKEGSIVQVYPLPSLGPVLSDPDASPEPTGHFGPALTAWLEMLQDQEAVKRRRQSLLEDLRRTISGIEAQLQALRERLKEAEEAERYRRWGELLLTFSHDLPEGATEAQVINYEMDPPQPLSIPLPKGKRPVEAALYYFALYRKLKGAKEVLPSVIERLQRRRHEAQRLIEQIQGAKRETLEELAEKVQRVQSTAVEKVTPPSPKRHGDFSLFLVAGGYEVWVGRNKEANQRLIRSARPDDLWFHVKGAPGAHALLRVKKPKEQVPEGAIRQAAEIAAYFSKRRTSSWVEVDYTRARYVRPVKGKTLYTEFKTIAVEPKVPKGQGKSEP